MIDQLFVFLDQVDDAIWSNIAPVFIVLLGGWLTWQSRFYQLTHFPRIARYFFGLVGKDCSAQRGIHPLRSFFASVGGCVGIGNVALACTAVKYGGPGALFWIWVTALLGVMLKYAEVHLGMQFRVRNNEGGYTGGPTYFLQSAFSSKWIPLVVSFFLCVYGVEILQFNIITQSFTENFSIPSLPFVLVLMALVFYAGLGGVDRVGRVCSLIIPVFTGVYVLMGLWVLLMNVHAVPAALLSIVTGAFTGHAAVGGFAGSTAMMALTQGVRRACYSGDIGIGYASVMHSESATERPERQAALTVMEIFIDTFVTVTTTILIVLVTDVWQEPIHESLMVQTVLGRYFPGVHYFMPSFILLLGYSTIIAYFCFGLRASEFMSPRWGKQIYVVYAAAAFIAFSYLPTAYALNIQSIAGGLLLVINVWGMYRLRRLIRFDESALEPEASEGQ